LEWLPADQLSDHPNNWRSHPPRQVRGLRASLEANGWAGVVLVNEAGGQRRIIDGHARKQVALEMARKTGSNLVPCLIGSWTPQQERSLLTTLDPLTAEAELDVAKLNELLAAVETDLQEAVGRVEQENRQALATLATELGAFGEIVTNGADSSFFPSPESWLPEEKPAPEPPATLPGVQALRRKEEIAWDEWPTVGPDLPQLRADMLGEIKEPVRCWLGERDTEPCEHYLYVWGATAVADLRPNVTVAFYSTDDRHECWWQEPHRYAAYLLSAGVTTAIGLDFSTWENDPLPIDLHQTFKSAWVNRYLQECGVRVVPSLSLGNTGRKEIAAYRYLPIPQKPPAVACQLCTSGRQDAHTYLRRQTLRLAKAVDLLRPESLLVYGVAETVAFVRSKLPATLHIVGVEPFMRARGKLVKARGKHPIPS